MATAKSKVSTAQVWKKSASGIELEVPSGNVCLARRIDLRVLLKRGVIPNSLMPFVNKAISGKETNPEDFAAELQREGNLDKKLEEMMELVDLIVCECVIEPKVYPIPADGEERDESLLYVDEVLAEDKNFILQWAVGGTTDLEKFRTEQGSYVARLQSVNEPESQAI
jgi:hypothetical protein